MSKRIKITIVGDILFQNELKFEHNIDCLSGVTSFLKRSDYVIGNLETPISDIAPDYKTDKYCFTAPKEFAKLINEAGIDFVATANNHCLDNGIGGIGKTIKCLDDVGIEHDGTYIDKKNLFTRQLGGHKIGILSYTYGTNAFYNLVYLSRKRRKAINLTQAQELSNPFIRKLYLSNDIITRFARKIMKNLNLFQLKKQVFERNEKSYFRNVVRDIQKMNNRVDYTILMLHDGGQGNKKPIRRVLKEAKRIEKKMNNGAIIINHEHMVHPVTVMNKKVITYSLGNFLGANGSLCEPYDKMQEYSVGINIYLGDKIEYTCTFFKNVVDANGLLKTRVLYDLINEIDEGSAKEQLIKDLDILKNKVGIYEKGIKEEYYVG